MVLTNETKHTYPFHWDVVTRAFWNKYPNSLLSHVERMDVLERRVDEQGCLRTSRLAKCTQGNLPSWAKSMLGTSSYVFEETVCDPKTKTLVLKSTNLSFRSVATVEETCVYSVHPENNDMTLYQAEAKVTAFVPMLSKKLESFSVSRGAETAAKGIRAVEAICNDIFEGTFEPAYCEPACGAASSVSGTEKKQ
uniref:PRELI/MSF1 domain-containing protein n=1 Tax=Globisporangium ultimum (strain ATCC 200006 / CBS 805.95 / DAOM BR144) TaxID=431595 RepID=K3X4H0_GLOUD